MLAYTQEQTQCIVLSVPPWFSAQGKGVIHWYQFQLTLADETISLDSLVKDMCPVQPLLLCHWYPLREEADGHR